MDGLQDGVQWYMHDQLKVRYDRKLRHLHSVEICEIDDTPHLQQVAFDKQN